MSSKLQINEILFSSYSQNNGSIKDTCALSNCAYYIYNIISLNTILTRLVSKLLTKGIWLRFLRDDDFYNDLVI
jgi:hypothetical protein